ncbi:hypothetical protein IAD21_05871 [Abditibacteriota bacterium]|nr:hypothetical protein IAD21_05871 [Abditibacteriota bacterium]
MDTQLRDGVLTTEERKQAYEFWEVLMFSPSRFALDEARLAFKTAPQPVQLAVMTSIGRMWAQPVDPRPEDNPFIYND